jgi:predicted permease
MIVKSLWLDVRYGLRMMRKNPGFTIMAVLTLALGIGANAAIFSLVNATLLQQLPVKRVDQLVYIHKGNPGSVFSYPDYVELRDRNDVLTDLIAWGGIAVSLNRNGQLDASEGAEMIGGAIVTGNYFDLLGVKPALGRLISHPDDQTPGGHPVVVISHGLWQRRFGGAQQIIGQQLTLNGHSFTVIGVTPAEFGGAQLGVTRDLYVPMMMQAVVRPPRGGYSGEMNPDLLKVRYNNWLYALGRLKPGVSREQAQAALTIAANQEDVPTQNTQQDPSRRRFITVSPVSEGDQGQRGQMISIAKLLLSVVAAVLLIACANVANLLLARASARRKEIAVRLALGADRGRLIRQLLTESLLLGALGGATGLMLAWWAVGALKAMSPPPGTLPINPDFTIDLRVLLFTFGLSMLAAIIFGLAPAWRASRPDLVPALKDEVSGADEQTRRFTLRNLLVVTQVSLSLVLLIAAGLFLRSLKQAQEIDPGYEVNKLLVAPLNINLLRYTRTQGREFYRQVVERVESIPGVESASLARVVVLSGLGSTRSLLIEGQSGPDDQSRSDGRGSAGDNINVVNSNVVSLKYFATMGIRLLKGRDFSAADTENSPRVVIVNESFARRHFGNEEPLGKRISFAGTRGPWQEIIGVVSDSKYSTVGEAPTRIAYLSVQQNHETGMTLHVRTSVDPASLAAAVRREVQALEKNLPLSNISPMTEALSASLYAARMGAMLLGVFGGLALLLAAIGLYGVMSFAVSKRTRELGIRLALGAQRGEILGLVLKEGMILVGIGIAFGLTTAFLVTRLLTSFLYGISAMDAFTFTGIPLILTMVALAACYLPARRAMKVDPILALRSE